MDKNKTRELQSIPGGFRSTTKLPRFVPPGPLTCTNCPKQATELHHLVAQSKMNKARFGKHIHDTQNLIPVCHDCHTKARIWDKPLRKKAEKYLKQFDKSKITTQ